MKNTIKNKRGFIKFDVGQLESLTVREFKALYSTFFPIQMEISFESVAYDTLLIYGYSEQFEELEEGTPAIEYMATIEQTEHSISVTLTPSEQYNEYLHTISKY